MSIASPGCHVTDEMQDFIQNLVKLVEDTYELNGQTKVVMIGHSMGNPYTLYMLNHQPQAWKDKYVHTFISLAAPWGGAAKTVRLMASGQLQVQWRKNACQVAW